ncbi:hypothetical protein [Spongiactinospora sp. 9N601]|uniref:hypothetical protein n=1 Tax=Spongiactinospora sp. 9N601 TaxID=3375149 RepID=UPI0037953A55
MPARPLRELIDFARRNSPFYGELYRDLPQGVAELTELPIIDQTAFWAANTWPDNRLLTGPLTDAAIYTSGGTTGAPKFSPWTRTEHADSVTAFGAGMVAAGLRPGHRVANLFLAGELYGGFLYIEHSLHNAPVENVRLPIAGHAADDFIAGLIGTLGINVLAGLPNKLARVAEEVTSRGGAADSVELLLFAGDLLFDDLRPVLAKAFPRATIASLGYASVDGGLIGAPVPGGDVRVHEAFPNRTVVELIDEATAAPITTPSRPGRVVVTNLFRTLMPIIRYPVGDLAEWTDAECRRFRLVGRTTEGARVANVPMGVADIRKVLTEAAPALSGSQLQLVQRRWNGRDGLLLRISCASEPPTDLTDQLIKAIYAAKPMYPESVTAGTVHPLSIEWAHPSTLAINPRSGKVLPVVDERPHI